MVLIAWWWLSVLGCLLWPTGARYELLPGATVTWGIPPAGTPEGVPLASAISVGSVDLTYQIQPSANHHPFCITPDCGHSQIQFLCNGAPLSSGACDTLTTVQLPCSGNLSISVMNNYSGSRNCGQYINFLAWELANVTGTVPAGAVVTWGIPAAGSPVGVPLGSAVAGLSAATVTYGVSCAATCVSGCSSLGMVVQCAGGTSVTLSGTAGSQTTMPACPGGALTLTVQNTGSCGYRVVFDAWALSAVAYELPVAQTIQWGVPAAGPPIGVPVANGLVTTRLNVSYFISISSANFLCSTGCDLSTLRLLCGGTATVVLGCNVAAVADLNCINPAQLTFSFTNTGGCALDLQINTWALLAVTQPDISPSPSPVSPSVSPSPVPTPSPLPSIVNSPTPSPTPSPASGSPSVSQRPSLSRSPSPPPSPSRSPASPSGSPSPPVTASPAASPSTSPSPEGAPQIVLSPTSGLTTREDGQTAALTVALRPTPRAQVSVEVQSLNAAEGTVSPAVLTFTTANYNVPQTVTITGVQDKVTDGAKAFLVLFTATSTDSRFQALSANVTVTNLPYPWLISHSMNGCTVQTLPCNSPCQPCSLTTLQYCTQSATLTIVGTEFGSFAPYSVAFINGQPNTPDAIPTCTSVTLNTSGNLECAYTPNANACGVWRLQVTVGSIVVPSLSLYLKASRCISPWVYSVVMTTPIDQFDNATFTSTIEKTIGLNCTMGPVWDLTSIQAGSTAVTFSINGLGNALTNSTFTSLTSGCVSSGLRDNGTNCDSTRVYDRAGLLVYPISPSPTPSMSDSFQWWWVVWPPIVGVFLILGVIALVWWLKQRRARREALRVMEKADFPQWAPDPGLGYQNTTPIPVTVPDVDSSSGTDTDPPPRSIRAGAPPARPEPNPGPGSSWPADLPDPVRVPDPDSIPDPIRVPDPVPVPAPAPRAAPHPVPPFAPRWPPAPARPPGPPPPPAPARPAAPLPGPEGGAQGFLAQEKMAFYDAAGPGPYPAWARPGPPAQPNAAAALRPGPWYQRQDLGLEYW